MAAASTLSEGIRCYACRAEAPASASEGGCAGLCANCRRQSADVRRALVQLYPERFSAGHFHGECVDPPVWKPQQSCARCGVIGQCHGWNEWTYRESDDGVRLAEGDGFLFCGNCQSLIENRWPRATEMMDMALPMACSAMPAARAEPPSRTVVLMEVALLFVLAMAIMVMLL